MQTFEVEESDIYLTISKTSYKHTEKFDFSKALISSLEHDEDWGYSITTTGN